MSKGLKQTAVCHQCGGTGKVFLRPNAKIRYIDCEICCGSGVMKKYNLWQIQGKLIKDWRISNNISLREFAKEHLVDPSNLSKMEYGIIKPNPELLKLVINIIGNS